MPDLLLREHIKQSLTSLLDEAEVIVDERLAGLALKQNDYRFVNTSYRAAIREAMTAYIDGGSAQAQKNVFKRSIFRLFPEAFQIGYGEGGGDELNIDPEASAWLNSRMESEIGFVDELFTSLKNTRDMIDAKVMKRDEAQAIIVQRVDGYSGGMDGVYNAGKMWGAKNQMLTWHLGATEEHCSTCAMLNGKAHRAKWYIFHDYIPRKPGAAMECKGYRCACWMTNKKGERVTL